MTSDDKLSAAAALVEKDVSGVLGQVVDRGHFKVGAVGTLDGSGSYVVEWVYSEGTNTPEFLGLGAQPQKVAIHGVTIVEGDGDDATFRRYIDWASVYAQFDL